MNTEGFDVSLQPRRQDIDRFHFDFVALSSIPLGSNAMPISGG